MMSNKHLSIFLLGFLGLLLPVSLPAQTAEWQPISPQELALHDNPNHPGDAAMVLLREINTNDEKRFQTNYYRIKIFKEEGKKYADIEIPYFEKETQIEDIRARTIRPDGTTVEFHGEVFDKVVQKSKGFELHIKALAIPAIEIGSIVEYSYSAKWLEKFPDVLQHPDQYIIKHPLTFPTERWVLQGDLFIRHERFVLRPLPKATLQWALVRPPQNAAVQQAKDGSVSMELNNIAPLETEDFMFPDDMLNSRVHFWYSVGYISSASSFWQERASLKDEELGKFIGKYKSIDQAVAQLTSPSDSTDAKLRKIYARVQQIRYVSYEAKTAKERDRENLKDNKSVEDVLKRGYAYQNEINFLFVAMVRAAGMEAYIVELTERRSGVFDQSVLDPSQLNSVVVLVRASGKDSYLDPATLYCPYGMLPWEETGVPGLLIKNNGGFVIIDAQNGEFAVTARKAMLKLLPDGRVQGTLQVSYAGQEALTRRLDEHHEDDAGKRKAIQDEVKSWLRAGSSVTIDKITGWEDSEGPLVVDCQIMVPAVGLFTGRRMLFQPSIFHDEQRSPFQQTKRVYPVYFRYAYRDQDDIVIEIPTGFNVESLPAGVKEVTGQPIRFQTVYKSQPGMVEFHRAFSLDGIVFSVANFPFVKSMYDQRAVSDAENIVLQSSQATPRN